MRSKIADSVQNQVGEDQPDPDFGGLLELA